MKGWKKYAVFCGSLLLLTGCERAETDKRATEEEETVELALFSDVEWWNMPKWSLEEGSITEGITEKTGVTVLFTIPPREAEKQLSIQLLKSELPDIISITDETVMKQLVDAGKVWRLVFLSVQYVFRRCKKDLE